MAATTVYQYRVWCSTDSKWVYTDYRESAPTACPENNGHAIDTSKTAIVDSLTVDFEKRREDDYLWVAINNIPRGTFKQIVGVGDDIANGTRLGGTAFAIDESTSGNHDVTWQFKDTVYVLGGVCESTDADADDVISFGIKAPATAATSNPGAGAYGKQTISAAGARYTVGAGDYDLNLTEMLNANVCFTKVVPVPNPAGTGYFDYDPLTCAVTANAGATGGYDLLDHAVELSTFVAQIPVLPYMDLRDGTIVSTPVLPHYHYRVRYERAVASAFTARWRLICGFYNTRTGLWGD